MIKISVFIEDKSGKVLGEVHSQREKIIIGSSDACSLKIDDNKMSSVESEIYVVNGECWIQVGKEGAPITFKNKQYRTLKIEKSCELQFRNYKLKVMLESAAESSAQIGDFDLSIDSTRIVSEPSKLALDEATRILKKEEEKLSEPTRVVLNNEATRVVEFSEATRVVAASEATRVVNLEKEETQAQADFDENKTRVISYNETKNETYIKNEENDFFFNNSPKVDSFKKINIPPEVIQYVESHFKEVLFFTLAGVICLYIGKTVLFGKNSKKINLEEIAESQIQQFQNNSINANNRNSDKLKYAEKTVPTVSREVYLRELSGLFDKN